MSTVPLIIAAIPVPEPPPETATATLGFSLPYCSARDCAALTRVSEPLFWISVLADALVEVTGACRLDSKLPTDQPGSIQLTVSSADRVRVLKWPPFWTWPGFQRWAGIVSAAAAAPVKRGRCAR